MRKAGKKRTTMNARTRQTHEKRAPYRTARWKIPSVTPIGADAPVSKTLPLAVKRIAKQLQPDKIILFGSYAYGNPTPDSDVDLLVVMQTRATSRERSWSVSSLLIPRPFPVDILVRTPQEVAAESEYENSFIKNIVTEGKVLYKRRERPTRMD